MTFGDILFGLAIMLFAAVCALQFKIVSRCNSLLPEIDQLRYYYYLQSWKFTDVDRAYLDLFPSGRLVQRRNALVLVAVVILLSSVWL